MATNKELERKNITKQLAICPGSLGDAKTQNGCTCLPGSFGDPRSLDGCKVPVKALKLSWTILVIAITAGLLAVLSGITAICFGTRKRKLTRLREKFFEQNGGVLLKQRINSVGSHDAMTLFSTKQLQKATDNYSHEQIIGRGAYGVVYKGILSDKRVVAIKKSKLVDGPQAELFINEVLILTQVIHRNVLDRWMFAKFYKGVSAVIIVEEDLTGSECTGEIIQVGVRAIEGGKGDLGGADVEAVGWWCRGVYDGFGFSVNVVLSLVRASVMEAKASSMVGGSRLGGMMEKQ
ncbi:wall-associated receptor kinase 2-like protein [Tanacetum coccineum]